MSLGWYIIARHDIFDVIKITFACQQQWKTEQQKKKIGKGPECEQCERRGDERVTLVTYSAHRTRRDYYGRSRNIWVKTVGNCDASFCAKLSPHSAAAWFGESSSSITLSRISGVFTDDCCCSVCWKCLSESTNKFYVHDDDDKNIRRNFKTPRIDLSIVGAEEICLSQLNVA